MGLVLVLLLVAGLAIIRKHLAEYIAKIESVIVYRHVPVEEFTAMQFSGRWSVRVRQSREFKLEIGTVDSIQWKIENKEGVLVLNQDTTSYKNDSSIAYVRVTAPFILNLEMAKGNELNLDDISQDSLRVFFEDGGLLTGYGNTITYFELITNGEVRMEMRDDPND